VFKIFGDHGLYGVVKLNNASGNSSRRTGTLHGLVIDVGAQDGPPDLYIEINRCKV